MTRDRVLKFEPTRACVTRDVQIDRNGTVSHLIPIYDPPRTAFIGHHIWFLVGHTQHQQSSALGSSNASKENFLRLPVVPAPSINSSIPGASISVMNIERLPPAVVGTKILLRN